MPSSHSSTSPNPPTSSPLLQLPADLMDVILTYLPLPTKFAAFTHISHSTPQPTASTFQHDHLELSADCLAWLNTRQHNIALLSQLRSLTFLRGHVAALCQHPPLGPQIARVFSPCPTIAQPFSSLRILYLSLPAEAITAKNQPLLALFASSAISLPLLHTLCIAVQPRGNGGCVVVPISTSVLSSWLGGLPSLVHLTLAMWMDVRAVLYLSSLPLLSLDLRDCRIPPVLDTDSHSETVSGTLRRLYLPSDDSSERALNPTVRLAQLLAVYAEHSRSDISEVKQAEVEEEKQLTDSVTHSNWRLEHVRYAAFCPTTLQYATAISSLTSLHITSFNTLDSLNTFFFTASPVGLPNLSRLVVPVTDIQSRRTDETTISEACLAFFPSFAPQLRHLTLVALSSSARACQRLFATVLTCTRLISLTLTSDLGVGQPIALPARIERMPLLKKLHIHSPAHRSERPSHLQHADVVRLLESCPALTDVSLRLPNASINLLSTIARVCSQVRELTIRSDDSKLWHMSEEFAAAAGQLLPAAFASLHTLYVDYDLKAGQSAPQPTAALLHALSLLLSRAPIRRLCLLPHIDVTHLPFYASFPHLVRLHLHHPPLRTVLQHYCRQPDTHTRTGQSEADRRVDRWMARVEGERQREKEASEECSQEDVDGGRGVEEVWLSRPAFVDERVFVESGRSLTGREAWLERGQVVAATEMERRRAVALEKARLAEEEECKKQQREAKKSSRKKKAAELVPADAFFAASGIKRKR